MNANTINELNAAYTAAKEATKNAAALLKEATKADKAARAELAAKTAEAKTAKTDDAKAAKAEASAKQKAAAKALTAAQKAYDAALATEKEAKDAHATAEKEYRREITAAASDFSAKAIAKVIKAEVKAVGTASSIMQVVKSERGHIKAICAVSDEANIFVARFLGLTPESNKKARDLALSRLRALWPIVCTYTDENGVEYKAPAKLVKVKDVTIDGVQVFRAELQQDYITAAVEAVKSAIAARVAKSAPAAGLHQAVKVARAAAATDKQKANARTRIAELWAQYRSATRPEQRVIEVSERGAKGAKVYYIGNEIATPEQTAEITARLEALKAERTAE